MKDPLVTSLSEFGTTTLSDALDTLGTHGQCVGLSPIWAPTRVAGRAFTVGMAPAAWSPGSTGDFLDDVPAGGVVAIDNGGVRDCTVWGDLMTQTAASRGLAGTVIDGVCRDTPSGERFNYPIFSRGRHTRSGKLRVQAESVNQTITIGGVRVAAGDVIVADADGVIVVPRGLEQAVLAAAREIHSAEDQIRHLIDDGVPLREARQRVGYFSLTARRNRGTKG